MRYFEIVEMTGLGPWYKEATESDPAMRVNGFHNQQHRNYVIEDVFEGLLEEEYVETRGPSSPLGEALLAAIYHDWGHSGGKAKDDVNTATAVAHVQAVHESGLWPTGMSLDRVLDHIRSMEFPYKVPNEALTPVQRVLRDADLMSAYRATQFQHILLGLGGELGQTLPEMVRIQQFWLANVQPVTDWGKARIALLRPGALTELEALARILEVG